MTSDETKSELKAAFARDPLPLLHALGLRIDERKSKAPGKVWCFDGAESDSSLLIGGRAGTEGLCTRFGAGEDEVGDCFALVQRERNTTFPEALALVASVYGIDVPPPASRQVKRSAKTREIVYQVRHANGEVLACHHRIEDAVTGKKKSLWWSQPDGTKGLAGLAAENLPLYGLPELLAEPAGTAVVVCEGEKDCDAVTAAGILAVGTYGTGAVPDDHALRPLTSYTVILWPDADSAGRKHMDAIGARLQALGAEVVFMVDWPDAPEKAGAADCEPQKIAELVNGAVTWEPKRDEPQAPSWTSAEALKEKVADVTWLWPGWIPSGFVTVLAAAPGDGKSALALDFAGRILTGTQWPDGQPNTTPATGPVLVLDSEGCQAIWVQRIRDWGLPGDRILFPGTGFERVLLDDPNALLAVRSAAADMGARLLVVDSLRAALPAGVDENSSEIGAILAPWADLARDTGLALVIVHHFGKPNQHDGRSASLDRLRGSTAIGAAARSVLAIDRPQEETRAEDPTMRLSCVKSNLAAMPEPIGFAVTSAGVTYCEAPAPDPDKYAPARAIAAEFLLDVLKDGAVSVGELVDRAGERGISKNAVYRAKDKLRLVDLTDESDPMRRRKLWGLPAKGTDSSGWR